MDVSPLTPEEISELRALAGNPGMSEERFSELIRLMDAVVMAAIDIHHGRHPVQISLSQRANSYFQGNSDHARMGSSLEHETVDLDFEGANNATTIGPEGHFAP
jgi:hypothetical protein